MKLIIIVFAALAISGCRIGEKPQKDILIEQRRGDARIELFTICMNLAANINKATAQHYNDLDEVIIECSSQSYYMTNFMVDL